MKNVFEIFLTNRYSHLLISLVTLLLFFPFIRLFTQTFPLFTFLFLTLIILTLRILNLKRSIFIVLSLIAALSFFLDWYVQSNQTVEFAERVPIAIALGYSILISVSIIFMIATLIQERKVDADVVMGGISIYLLIGVLWSLFYQIIDTLVPNAFNYGGLGVHEHQDLLYYSFVTLTTLGYGDIIPANDFSRSFSTAEAIIGQVYLTVFIAHLVGLYVADRSRA